MDAGDHSRECETADGTDCFCTCRGTRHGVGTGGRAHGPKVTISKVTSRTGIHYRVVDEDGEAPGRSKTPGRQMHVEESGVGPAELTHTQVPYGDKLRAMSDDALLDLFGRVSGDDRQLDEAGLQRIYAELDRRESRTADEVAFDESPEQQAIDRLVMKGYDYREAYAEVHGQDPEELDRAARTADVDARKVAGKTREQVIREAYREWVHVSYVEAEAATNGHMLSPAGKAAAVDPDRKLSAVDLFSGPRAAARKYASEELKRWWEQHPRQTYTEFRADVLGRREDKRAAAKIRNQGQEKDFGL